MFEDLLLIRFILLSDKASIILSICGKKKVGHPATITATITSPSLILANRLTRRVACVGGGVVRDSPPLTLATTVKCPPFYCL